MPNRGYQAGLLLGNERLRASQLLLVSAVPPPAYKPQQVYYQETYQCRRWCRYALPPGGVLCDPFCRSETTLLAGLGHGASQVIGIDKVAKYLRAARRRIEEG
jgi:DNA modification methylase